MKRKDGIRFFSKHKILKDVLGDLMKCLNQEASRLKLDVQVGVHNVELGRSERPLVGIQTEHLYTAGDDLGWMDISREQLLSNFNACDYIIDFSYRNIRFYQEIEGFDLGKLIAGPYIFPDFLPEACDPTDNRPIFVGTLKRRVSRQERLAKYSRTREIHVEENMFGAELDAALRNASAMINIHNTPSIVTELPRLLKAYLNGSILLSEPLDTPFIAGRHYVELKEGETSEISRDRRQEILTNIHNDFSDYRFSSVLNWVASGAIPDQASWRHHISGL